MCIRDSYGTGGKKLKMQRKNVYGTGTYNTEFEGIVNNMEQMCIRDSWWTVYK